MKNIKKQKGFTLIELMLVVLIIGILSGVMLSVINVKGIQQKSRDARRVSDLKKIQTALELYYADYRGYPMKSTWENVNTPLSTISLAIVPNFLSKMPSDPVEGKETPDSNCYGGTSTHGYYYITPDCVGIGCLVSRYVAGAVMEVETSAADNLCSQLNNCLQGYISNCNCGGSYCYAVENPL
jgi:prepilin-type N-terminal cleavage/methylation domain-containing protein